jgi:hypothetical protein
MARYFAGLSRRVLRSKGHGVPGMKDVQMPSIDFSAEARTLTPILRSHYLTMADETLGIVATQIGAGPSFDLNARNIREIESLVATRVTQINDSTRSMIRSMVRTEIENGSNADRLQRNLQGMMTGWTKARAHAVALTETGFAYNFAALSGYRQSGLVETVTVYDGDDCGWTQHDDPDLANRSKRTLDDAQAHPLAHPHCQRAFGPTVVRPSAAQGSRPATQEWKPSMTRSEAQRWSQGSATDGELWHHFTSEEAAEAIAREGFRESGGILGRGVYLTGDSTGAGINRARSTTKLDVAVNARKVETIDKGGFSGVRRWMEENAIPGEDDPSQTASRLGIDAFRILQPDPDAKAPWLVVFDPKRVTVIAR